MIEKIVTFMDRASLFNFIACCPSAHDLAGEMCEVDPLILEGAAVNIDVIRFLNGHHRAFQRATEIYILNASSMSLEVRHALGASLSEARNVVLLEIRNTNMVDPSFLLRMPNLYCVKLENGNWDGQLLRDILDSLQSAIPVVKIENNAHLTAGIITWIARSSCGSRDLSFVGCQPLSVYKVREILESGYRQLQRFDCNAIVDGSTFILWYDHVLRLFPKIIFGKTMLHDLRRLPHLRDTPPFNQYV